MTIEHARDWLEEKYPAHKFTIRDGDVYQQDQDGNWYILLTENGHIADWHMTIEERIELLTVLKRGWR